jgi:hypothetical protein
VISELILVAGNRWDINKSLKAGRFEALIISYPKLVESKFTGNKDVFNIPLIVNIESYEKRANYYLQLSKAKNQFDDLEIKYRYQDEKLRFGKGQFIDRYCLAEIADGLKQPKIVWLYKA